MALLNVLSGPIIGDGESVSNVLDLGSDYIVGLVIPETWKPALVSVIVSPDGDNFHDLFDATGAEVTFNAVPGTIINIDPTRLMLGRYLRLRSGSRDDPQPQPMTCQFRTIGTMQLSAHR